MINKNSNTTRLIDKLVVKDYVVRDTDRKNRRKIDISITKKGLEILSMLDICLDEIEEPKIVEKLTIKEQEQLNTLLEKLND